MTPRVVGVGGRMITLPHRGNGLIVKCQACEHTVQIGGREIVTRFTKWLRAPVSEWASTLRCGECQSRDILVYARHDQSSGGFFLSTAQPGQMEWANRLNTWLGEVGSDIEAYRDVLQDVPSVEEMREAGIRTPNSKTPPDPKTEGRLSS